MHTVPPLQRTIRSPPLGLHNPARSWLIPMLSFLYECFLATRPYSFTTVVVPVLLTAAIAGGRQLDVFLTEGFARSLIMGLTVLAGANLANTCDLICCLDNH